MMGVKGNNAVESKRRSRRWPITDEHRRTIIELVRKKLESANARETSQLTRLLQVEQQILSMSELVWRRRLD